jgi:hypothetical protein
MDPSVTGGEGDDFGDQGWGDYPTAQMAGVGGMAALWTPPLSYTPSLTAVGSGSAYWPGDVTADAQALNVLGYLTDTDPYWVSGGNTAVHPSTGSQAGDMAASAGAWDPNFQAALKLAQAAEGATVDGWIGPQSRGDLANAVAAWNQANAPNAPPQPVSPTPPAPNVPPPAVIPVLPGNGGLLPPVPEPSNNGGGSTPTGPIAWFEGLSTIAKVGVVAGAVAVVGGGLWYAGVFD